MTEPVRPEGLPWTGERYLPEVHGNLELEHVHRYLFARELVGNRDVLDIASGEGYGAALLAEVARSVVGVDIAEEVITHARERYRGGNLRFKVGACDAIPLAEASVDVVVSFETIEHHDRHEGMMAEIKRVLRPGGLLVISSPDRHQYALASNQPNPFHVKELSRAEFEQLLQSHFRHAVLCGQRIVHGSAILPAGPTEARNYTRPEGQVITARGLAHPLIWVALASDGQLPAPPGGLLERPVDESDVALHLAGERNAAFAERDAAVAEREAAVAERDAAEAARGSAVAEREAAVAEREASLAVERELRARIAERDEQLAQVTGSAGWRLLERYRRLVRGSAALSAVHAGLTRLVRGGSRPGTSGSEREGDPGPSVLVLRSTDLERVRRALQHAREQYPGHAIALALPEAERYLFGGWPGVDRFYGYRPRGRFWGGIPGFLRALRRATPHAVILPTSPGFRSPHFRLFVLAAFAVRAPSRLFMDPDGAVQPCRPRHVVASLADVSLFCLLLPVARLATAFAQACARYLPRPKGAPPGAPGGALAILVPVLPDISHTFVYREVLSLLAQNGRARRMVVVALEEGNAYPLHEEARELLAHAVFVPACSLAKYIGLYLYYACVRPRRLAGLLDAYAPPPRRDPWLFLRVQSFDGLHPARGLALAHLLEREGVGYVHCYGTSYPATRARVVSQLLAIPWSLSTFVDFDYDYAFKNLREKLDAAEFVVACTDFCRGRLLQVGGERLGSKTHVIHHALGGHGIYGRTQAPPSGPARSPAIFTACRLVEKKGLEYLVHACSILKRHGVSVRCAIIGEGPERDRLERLVAVLGLGGDVEFAGALPNDAIWTRVGPEDICVVPSIYAADGERDGIPVILLEAMARGHAVVTTDVSGIPELVVDGTHGVLVPERDPEALAAVLERLLADAAERQRLATAGQRRVWTDFAIEDKARRLWGLIAGGSAPSALSPGVSRDGAARTTASVSVILVNHNGARFMPALFASLSQQTCAPEEVWLFDNASTDGSAELAEELCPGIRVVRYGRNTGYSHPVNEGLRRSAADYRLVLNVDVVLEAPFIEELVAALERYPTAGWAAGKMLKLTESGKSGDIDCLGHHMRRSRYAVERDYSRPFAWRDYEAARFVFGASACAALYRATMLDDVQLQGEYFDEDFFAYFEDVDLDWRAQLRGWKCVYVPGAVGYHMRGGSGLIKRAEIAACYLSNRWLMVAKNDTSRDVARDLIPIAEGLARDLWRYAPAQPQAVWLAARRLIALLPTALAKRRSIQRGRVVPRSYIRSLIRS
jgi:GT2 family glycosyltransferase/glycosyltransferase involved in cell wall biosynthesis/SAM-dependent methyltransferase